MTAPGGGAVDEVPHRAPDRDAVPLPATAGHAGSAPGAPAASPTWRAAALRTRGFVALRGQRADARNQWTAALARRRVGLPRVGIPGAPDLAGALTDAGFAAGWRVVRGLPEPVAREAFRLGADLAARRDGPGVRRLRANLRRVVPAAPPEELDALVRAGLRSYARYWCEAFRLPSMDRAASGLCSVTQPPWRSP